MCLIKLMTGAVMLIAFTSKTAYASCRAEERAKFQDQIERLEDQFKELLKGFKTNNTQTQKDEVHGHLSSFRTPFENPSNQCDESNLNKHNGLLNYLHDTLGGFGGITDSLLTMVQTLNTNYRLCYLLQRNVNTPSIYPTLPELNEIEREVVTEVLHTYMGYLQRSKISQCEISSETGTVERRSQFYQLRMDEQKRARSDPWQYVPRENRAFDPLRSTKPVKRNMEPSDPLDDLARDVRVYDELLAMRNELKRNGGLLAYPEKETTRDIRGYGQEEGLGRQEKRDDLTNTWANDNSRHKTQQDRNTVFRPFAEYDYGGVRGQQGQGEIDVPVFWDSVGYYGNPAEEYKRALHFLGIEP